MKRDIRNRLSSLYQSGELSKHPHEVSWDNPEQKTNCFLPFASIEDRTPYGICCFKENEYSYDYYHGNLELKSLLECCGADLQMLTKDTSLKNLHPGEAFFLDIESTGLSAGTGTWAFLIGLGWFGQDQFHIRQYFLRKPGEEKAMLYHMAEKLKQKPAIITFNGKLFDLPLIHSRQILSGLLLSTPAIHLDLLQCARTLWRRRLPSRSLNAIENNILGLSRINDIQGAEIPNIYFDFIRNGNTDLLPAVLHHNSLDILSMVTLFTRLSASVRRAGINHPAEDFSLASIYYNNGEEKKGLSIFQTLASSRCEPLNGEAALITALHYKRKGKWAEAISSWHRALEITATAPYALLELAKYYEHTENNFPKALELTMNIVRIFSCRENNKYQVRKNCQLQPMALEHRVKRLKRRIASTCAYKSSKSKPDPAKTDYLTN